MPSESVYLQYVADNVDHNIHTLDGKGTFHGMGIIAAVWPDKPPTTQVSRISVSAEDIASVGRIERKHVTPLYTPDSLMYNRVEYEYYTDPDVDVIDALWDMSVLFRTDRPSWSGMMQSVYKKQHPGISSPLFLPMILMTLPVFIPLFLSLLTMQKDMELGLW